MAISDNGMIAGEGSNIGQNHPEAFLLVPTGGASSAEGGGISATMAAQLPPSAVAGQKAPIAATTVITNSGSTALHGKATYSLYLSTTATIGQGSIPLASGKKTIRLRPGQHVTVNSRIATFPATVPAGSYHLVVQITDPSGKTSEAASSGTIVVAPAYADISGVFLSPINAVSLFSRQIFCRLALH